MPTNLSARLCTFVLSLFLIAFALPAFAGPFEDAVAKFANDEFSDTEEAIGVIAGSGNKLAFPIISALQDGRLMAERIRTDQAPWINVAPDANAESATIDLFYSFIDGWRYKFGVQVSHKMFDRFKRDGVIDFKFGKAEVHEEFKVGLDNVGKFLDLCASSTK